MRIRASIIVALLALPAFASPLSAADRWEEAAGGAVAILPVPSESQGIVGGSLFCAQQKWGLLLRTVSVDPGNLGSSAAIDLDGNQLVVPAKAGAGSIQADLPAELIGALKSGSRFRFEMGSGDVQARAIFNLRNSGKVIDAIVPRCSQIDMTGYESVKLGQTGIAVDEATALFADEMKLMKAATTGATPVVTATTLDLEEGKQILFGALCGSVVYYGASGCTLWGWAKSATAPEWKMVYESEGVYLYLDRTKTRDGWPGIATLPVRNGTEASHWVWQDGAYARDETELATGATDPAAIQAQ